jgi:hypothetical protein
MDRLLDLDAPPPDIITRPGGVGKPRVRRLLEPVLFAAVGAAIMLVSQWPGHEPAARTAIPAAVPAADVPSPAVARGSTPVLLAPATATPGERLTVLAYRHTVGETTTHVWFDGVAVPCNLEDVAGRARSGSVGRFVTFEVPADASPGPHHLELRGDTGEVGAEPARLAVATIFVSAIKAELP